MRLAGEHMAGDTSLSSAIPSVYTAVAAAAAAKTDVLSTAD